jgi:transcriptional regulator with XRE-family HTH domain
LSHATAAGVLFGQRLRELRKKRDLTQVQLAEATGVPQNHISSMERGTIQPTIGTMIRLAVALDCKVSALVSVFDKEDLTKLLPK